MFKWIWKLESLLSKRERFKQQCWSIELHLSMDYDLIENLTEHLIWNLRRVAVWIAPNTFRRMLNLPMTNIRFVSELKLFDCRKETKCLVYLQKTQSRFVESPNSVHYRIQWLQCGPKRMGENGRQDVPRGCHSGWYNRIGNRMQSIGWQENASLLCSYRNDDGNDDCQAFDWQNF